jgi:hypothetical protein
VADDIDPDTERTVIVTTDDGRGTVGVIIGAVVILLLLLLLLYLTGVFGRDDETQVNVDATTPEINVVTAPETLPPPTQVVVVPGGQTATPPPPDVNVNVVTPPPEAPAEVNGANETNSL